MTYPASAGINYWTRIGLEGVRGGVDVLTIDPLTPTTLYAGTHEGLKKSTNGGRNWSYISGAGCGTLCVVLFLAIDPLTPTTLYLGFSDYYAIYLYKSTNGGGNWSQMNDIADTEFHVLAVAPTKRASFIYAGTNHGILEWTSLTSVPTISPWLLLLLDD